MYQTQNLTQKKVVGYNNHLFFSSNISIFFMYNSDEDTILKYLHKKFDRQGPSNLKRKYPDQNGTYSFGIKKVSIFPQNDVYTNKR